MSMIDYIQNALEGGENGVLASRPYISTNGANQGKLVALVNSGKLDQSGNAQYVERVLHANAGESALRATDWTQLDQKLVESAEKRLVIVNDLISSGLTYNAGDIGTLVAEWDAVSEITDAFVTMDGESMGDRDNQNFARDGVPIPIIHKEFNLGRRSLLAARRSGAALDTTHGAAAARSIARVSERMIFSGYDIQAKGSENNRYSIRGLTTHSAAKTETIKKWDASGTTAKNILEDILKMIKKAESEALAQGPYRVYLHADYAYRFREDFKDLGDKTLLERVLDVEEIEAVRFSHEVPKGKVVLVQWLDTTIDLAMISDISTIQWKSESGWTDKFQVFAAWAPRIKADFDGNLGVVIGNMPA